MSHLPVGDRATAVSDTDALTNSQPTDTHRMTGFVASDRQTVSRSEALQWQVFCVVEVRHQLSEEPIADLSKQALLKLTELRFGFAAELDEFMNELLLFCIQFCWGHYLKCHLEVTALRTV